MKNFVTIFTLILLMVCSNLSSATSIIHPSLGRDVEEFEPSKTYKIYGNVLSIDHSYPNTDFLEVNECFAKKYDKRFKIVTVRLRKIEQLTKGNVYPPIEAEGVKYSVFFLEDKHNKLANYKDEPLQEKDGFIAKAAFSGNECLSGLWLYDLEFRSRTN